MVPQKVLILEGDPDVKLALKEFLSEGPYEIYFATAGLDGLKIQKNVGLTLQLLMCSFKT